MNGKIIAVLAAGLTLTGCASAAHPPRPAVTATVHASQPALTLPAMTHEQERRECAALDMVRLGDDTYANQVQSMAVQYTVSQHVAAALIARTVRDACPAEVSVLP